MKCAFGCGLGCLDQVRAEKSLSFVQLRLQLLRLKKFPSPRNFMIGDERRKV